MTALDNVLYAALGSKIENYANYQKEVNCKTEEGNYILSK